MAYLTSALMGVALLATYILATTIYNLFLHPLSHFPGPVLWRISVWPRIIHLLRGSLPQEISRLHAAYGPVVRIKPNELSFSGDAQAWKDIYGHTAAGNKGFPKYSGFYAMLDNARTHIVGAPDHEHSVIRKSYAPRFADRNILTQTEPVVREHVDLLIQRLHESNGEKACNMREWLNWTTFDIIGDLGFGSPFGCLEQSEYHAWVGVIVNNVRNFSYLAALGELGFQPFVKWLVGSGLLKEAEEHIGYVKEKLRGRIALGKQDPDRVDLVAGLLKMMETGEIGMSLEGVAANSGDLIVAGSETTATVLISTMYFLAANPEKLARLTREVRSAFKNEDEITVVACRGLKYMHACLSEGMRRYPPPTLGLPRQVKTPGGNGGVVAGTPVPEGTVVAVWQWVINHDPSLWAEPDSYLPERFMVGEDPKFANDSLDAMQPFSSGPRDCIGKTLAYAEMYLIMARIIWNFDVELAEESKNWFADSKCYILWDKPPLNMYLKPANGEMKA